MKLDQTIPRVVRNVAQKYPETIASLSHSKTGSYEELNYHDFFQYALDFAGGLLELGVKRGEKIGLIADNRREWEQADIGLLSIGAIDVPRGCDSTEKDLSYILSFVECRFVITENASQVRKILNIKDSIPELHTIIAFDVIGEAEKKAAEEKSIKIIQFEDVKKAGHEWRKRNLDVVETELEKGQKDDLACIIFTSGTTGTPKGVMLSHGNFITQLPDLHIRIFLTPGERALCVLPVWHAYQRCVEYVIISQAATICYSKPVGSVLLADLKKLNPALVPAVPRVFEAVYDGIWRKMRKTGGITYAMFKFFVKEAEIWSSIDRKLRRKVARFQKDYIGFLWVAFVLPWIFLYPVKLLGNLIVFRKIRAMLGNNFRAGIVGGGSYPSNLDNFFWAIGVNIVEGYGLTETAPIVGVRPVACPIMRTVGTPLSCTEVRIVDDDGKVLGNCQKGRLQVKGGSVMKGYYKREDLTAKVMFDDGWFDTGDIAMLTVNGEIQLRGRRKDTIVLTGGENIEPIPIESAINASPLICASVVVGTNERGEDQRTLGVLIMPSKEDLIQYADANNISYTSYESLVEKEEIRKVLETEISSRVSAKTGFRSFEKINSFEIITKPFEIGVELSAKQEIIRYRICEIYKDKIAKLFSK